MCTPEMLEAALVLAPETYLEQHGKVAETS